ncbi:hypothetical protein [Stappia sp.]
MAPANDLMENDILVLGFRLRVAF